MLGFSQNRRVAKPLWFGRSQDPADTPLRLAYAFLMNFGKINHTAKVDEIKNLGYSQER